MEKSKLFKGNKNTEELYDVFDYVKDVKKQFDSINWNDVTNEVLIEIQDVRISWNFFL